jgi:mitochondrial chaperone BCS1
MDVWVEFKNSSKWQCEALFRNFFPSSEDFFATSSSAQGSEAGLEVDSDVEIPGLTCETLSSSPSSTSVSSSGAPSDKDKDRSPTVDPAFPPPTPSKTRSNALLDPATLAQLAKAFAEAIPEGEFSVAALQGCKLHILCLKLDSRLSLCTDLLKNKSRPEAAAKEAAQWVISERELRERLKREKEEKERKERIEVSCICSQAEIQ